MFRRASSEQGSVAVMVAACLAVLLGFAAFAIDLGDARQHKAQAQNSADFAALAGAGVLKDGTTAGAVAAARDYVGKNEFPSDAAQVNIPPAAGSRAGDAKCAEVVATEDLSTTFARIFGIETMTVNARAVACASPPLGAPYAVFAGSTTCADAVSFSGANRAVNGGVHSNNDMKVVSNGTVINGIVTYLNGDAPEGNIEYNPSTDNPRRLDNVLPYPDDFDIDDYKPLGSKGLLATDLGQYHYAPVGIDETWLALEGLLSGKTVAPGLYYTPGEIHLGGNDWNGTDVTFVTSGGTIHLNGNDFNFTPWDPDGLLLFSNKSAGCNKGDAVIKLNGDNHTWAGILYAPNGPLDFSGTNITSSLDGRLVANTVHLSGSKQTITRNESYPGRSDGFELVE
ncbi:MAG: Tad domain-containing protein [Actinomycetota bacterium]